MTYMIAAGFSGATVYYDGRMYFTHHTQNAAAYDDYFAAVAQRDELKISMAKWGSARRMAVIPYSNDADANWNEWKSANNL